MNDRLPASFRVAVRTLNRVRAAVFHLKGVEGAPQSMNQFADDALSAHVVNLEKTYNDGQPFPPRTGPLSTTPANMDEIAAKGRAERARRRADRADRRVRELAAEAPPDMDKIEDTPRSQAARSNRRARELAADIAEARDAGDVARQEQLEAELDAFVVEKLRREGGQDDR